MTAYLQCSRTQAGPLIWRFILFSKFVAVLSFSFPVSADVESAMAAFEHGDYELAAKELAPMIDRGVPEAQAMMGMMYLTGKGIAQNPDKGMNLIRQAAEQGLVDAQFWLGRHLMRRERAARVGLFTGDPQSESVKWLRLAAKAGVTEAMLLLGSLSVSRTPEVRAEGVKWLEKAVDEGSGEAAYMLSMQYMFRLEQVDEQQVNNLLKWLKRGAELGHWHSLEDLCQRGSEGPDLPLARQAEALGLDLVEAYKWCLVGQAVHFIEVSYIPEFEEKMTSKQIKQAKAKAKRWIRKHGFRPRSPADLGNLIGGIEACLGSQEHLARQDIIGLIDRSSDDTARIAKSRKEFERSAEAKKNLIMNSAKKEKDCQQLIEAIQTHPSYFVSQPMAMKLGLLKSQLQRKSRQ